MLQRLWRVFSLLSLCTHVSQCGLPFTGCPEDLDHVGSNVCVMYLGDTNAFCDAAERCAGYGKLRGWKLFLIGRNAPLLHKIHPFTSHPIWTGVNQLLIDRQTASDGWRDTNPDTPEYTTPLNFSWYTTQTSADSPYTYYDFHDKAFSGGTIGTTYDHGVYCEFGGLLPSAVTTTKFRTDFPEKISEFFPVNSEFTGCYINDNSRTTKLKCVFMCAKYHACRSVYFDEQTGQCIQVLYADSLLAEYHRKMGAAWVRFAKTPAVRMP
ncbi:hypothetical protein EG68_01892 [Paragonimus skrjabini miyazakii]|uniref:Apple domain-containing protein n=1 Tax=Paragonimus skrjabini miyazakii TaxID=59628 RepID=A0A8S9ZAC8_9TREM|nr:hypothetical protein EG68_01892 [Paragonimus skrjabini miyazakii]